MNIDLHCHTKMSDGSASIKELVEIAKLSKINVISVTDHDTFAGSNRAVVIGKRFGVSVLPGVEISGFDYKRGRKAHILCYVPKNQHRLEGLLKKIMDSRRTAMSISVQKVMHIYNLPQDMIMARVNGSTNIYKQHIMQALVDAGYADSIFGDVFQKLFHTKYGLANTKFSYPDVIEVIDNIREAGGVAVMAHPCLYDGLELMEELCEKGLIDGIEHSHPRNTDEGKEAIMHLAKKHKLILTGGTDFHGSYSSDCLPLGSCLTDEVEYKKIKKLAGNK